MGDNDQVELILDAIHTLRADLTGRMDRQEESRGKQWEAINALSNHMCPVERHADIENRVKSLELDRAKLAGIVVAASAFIGCVVWAVEKILK
jgi:hypothetical protein